MPDWKKIKAEYIRGVSYRQLAETYGVSFSSIQKRGIREKWTDLRMKSREKLGEKIAEDVANCELSRMDRLQTITDALLDKIELGIKKGTYTHDAKSIRYIVASIKDIKEIKGYKSELDLQEQMIRIKKLEKEVEEHDSDKEIRVVIDSSIEEYLV